jgi:hypothetical protein
VDVGTVAVCQEFYLGFAPLHAQMEFPRVLPAVGFKLAVISEAERDLRRGQGVYVVSKRTW